MAPVKPKKEPKKDMPEFLFENIETGETFRDDKLAKAIFGGAKLTPTDRTESK